MANHVPYLNYPDYLAKGYPIATGVIEGACRYLVKDRMAITGARWGLEGGEAVLKLRALVINSDFEAYWAFHETQEYQRNHQAKFAEISSVRIPLRVCFFGNDTANPDFAVLDVARFGQAFSPPETSFREARGVGISANLET